MQVILMEKVGHLGGLGDLVKVRDGYARNFLIPTGKAKRATDAALAEFEARRAELERAAGDKLVAAQALAERLADVVVRVARKAGVDGRLFGSVTNIDIAAGLQEQGFAIEKSAIRLTGGPIKTVGDTHVNVSLHGDVLATIAVSVVAEQLKL